MFELGALYLDVDGLRLRGLELGLGRCHIRASRDTGVVAILRELQRFLVTRRCIPEQLRLRIECTKLEVVDGKLGLERQATERGGCGTRLCAGTVCLDGASNLTKHIQCPGDVEGYAVRGIFPHSRK